MHNRELLHRSMLTVLLAAMLLMAGCSTYGERVAPVPLPSAQKGAVDVEGAHIFARAFVDPKAAEQAFGFDIRSAGLLPVQIVIDNQSGQTIAVQPQQTLLIDQQGNAWPLLSVDRAEERVQSTVARGESIKAGAQSSLLTALAGAVAGAAFGIVTGGNVGATAGKGAAAGAAIGAIGGGFSRHSNIGHDIRQDMEQQSFGNAVIREGELAHGYLFFPGKNEAETAQSLRLALRIGESTRIVNVPVSPAAVGG
ncbi:MAG: glycine zipper domain-containing protein [Nitrococcus sp.]|nr:glycine zipper domain-containing protein [Nitrococcus sp.]